MKTKITTTITVLLLSVLCISSVKAQTLVIWQKDGSKAYYSLDELPKTTFTLDDLVITTNTSTINFPLQSILRYTYEKGTVGIDNVTSQGISVIHRGNDIIVTGLPKGKTIAIYSVDGKALLSRLSDGNTRQTLSLDKIPTGVYVIKAETVNYKFMKR